MKRIITLKKASVLIIMLAIFPFAANGQIKVKPVVGTDFQFRINTSESVTSYFCGAFAGAQASLETSRLFTVRAGLQYKYARSANAVIYYNLQKGDAVIQEHSLELPASFGIRFKVGKSKMHIDIGPTGTFAAFANMKPNKDVLRYEKGTNYNLFDPQVAQRWNIHATGNFSFELGNFGLWGVGYRYGFLNMGTTDDTIFIHTINTTLLINL